MTTTTAGAASQRDSLCSSRSSVVEQVSRGH